MPTAEKTHVNGREYNFQDKHFQIIRKRVYELCGITLSEIKKDMVYGRLVRRLRALNINSFDEYCDLVLRDKSNELTEFVNAITTNLTSFFRENHHFEILAQKISNELIKTKHSKKIRIWSAGCSTGEEPYSIAITMKESIPDKAGWDLKILATDLDTSVLDTAKAGIYKYERVEKIHPQRLKRWFRKGKGDLSTYVKVVPEIQEIVTFKQLNLMLEWPMKGPFDVIFCRNVVIYFNKDTQKKLFNRFADMLSTGGYLCVGHSESLHGVSTRFQLLGNTIYKKIQ